VALNQSKVKLWRRCQKQFAFRYDYPIEFLGLSGNLEMVPLKKKLPLYRGSWMHVLQEALHHQWAGVDTFTITVGEGKSSITEEVGDWEEVHEILTEQFNQLFVEEQEDLGDLPTECERMFRRYLQFWRDDRDRYEVADVRGQPGIEITLEASLAKWGITEPFKGKLDLLVEDLEYGGLWIWDAKWVKTIPPPDERMMSPQSIMYVWALRYVYDLDVRGFVYNYGRTKAPTVPRLLKKGTLSVAQRMDTDYLTYLQAIKETHGDDWKRFVPYYREKLDSLKGRDALWFRRERIPVEDERILAGLREFIISGKQIDKRERRLQYVPRSYFYNCRFGCDYHSLCAAEFQGLDIEPLIDADYQITGERYEAVDLLDA
jgi:hypothetical protein